MAEKVVTSAFQRSCGLGCGQSGLPTSNCRCVTSRLTRARAFRPSGRSLIETAIAFALKSDLASKHSFGGFKMRRLSFVLATAASIAIAAPAVAGPTEDFRALMGQY